MAAFGKRGLMNIKPRKLNAYLLLFVLITLPAVALRAVASFLYLNDYGYYEGTLFSTSAWIVIIGGVLLLSYAILHRKDAPKRASFGGILTYAPGAPLALSLILLGISLITRDTETKLTAMLLPLLGILAILGAFYFVFAVLYEVKVCDLRAAFCMICTLFLILYAGYLYFDTRLAINAATKLVDQMAYVTAAVFFLYESRISLGREYWPLYTATGFLASLVCAYSAIPSALLYFFDGRQISDSLEEILVTLFLFAYIFCRTVLSLFLKGETPTPLMAALHEDARELSEAVAARGPLPFEPAREIPVTEAPEATNENESIPEEVNAQTDTQAEDARAQENNNEENSGN